MKAIADEAQLEAMLWWLQDSINSLLCPMGSYQHAENLQQLHDLLADQIKLQRQDHFTAQAPAIPTSHPGRGEGNQA